MQSPCMNPSLMMQLLWQGFREEQALAQSTQLPCVLTRYSLQAAVANVQESRRCPRTEMVGGGDRGSAAAVGTATATCAAIAQPKSVQ